MADRVYNGEKNKNGDMRGCFCTHGFSKTRLYGIWCDMKKRCYNTKNNRYHRYGGRGISLCDDWRDDFLSFYYWAVNNGYKDGLSIERVDIDGNYCPENCKWIPFSEQAKNKSKNRYITIDGVTRTMSDWAREKGVTPDLIKDRINKLRWTDYDAVMVPKGAKKRVYGNKR